MAMDLSIVIVNWNVAELLRECLRSLLAGARPSAEGDGPLTLGGLAAEIIVVDNASSDHSVALVRSEFPMVRLLPSDRNLGYTGGNNLGLAHARGRHVLILNPDTRVVGDAIATLVAYLDAHPEVALVGPRLVYPDGSAQPSRRRFPTLAMALMESTLLEQWFPRNRWARAYRMEDVPDDAARYVDWVNGACMLVRREAIEQVGALDEGYFMYSEELDWCRRMAGAGWRVAHEPAATVIHHEGRSSEQVAATRQVYFESSKVRYFRKHHGALTANLLRAALLGTYVVRLAVEGAKYALGHRRALRAQRLRAHLEVLRSGLHPPHRAGGHG